MLFPKSLVTVLALASGTLGSRCKPSSRTTTAPELTTSTTTSAAASSTSTTPQTPQYPCIANLDAPPSLNCAIHGGRSAAGLITIGIFAAVEDCALACAMNDQCNDFLWTPDAFGSYCQRYVWGGSVVPDETSPSIYYDKQCWTCNIAEAP